MPDLQNILKNRLKKKFQKEDLELDDFIQIADLLVDKVFTEKFEELQEFTDQIERKQGETGERGEVGHLGPIGVKGDSGESIKGDKGDKGERGNDGKDGPMGSIGPIGKTGKSGEDAIGEQGLQGEQGESGKNGSPDTPQEIADKVNTLEEVIEQSAIKGFDNLIKNIRSAIRDTKGKKVSSGGGGGSTSFELIVGDGNIKVNSEINLVDASSTNATITLPLASHAARREYHIKKVDSSTNTVTIKTQSGTIDGETTVIIANQYTSCRLYSDGKNYHILWLSRYKFPVSGISAYISLRNVQQL